MKNILRVFGDIDPGQLPIPCADGNCSSENVVSNIMVWVYLALGIVAVILIIWGGIQYILSEGEPEKTKRAQATITYTIIGLIIVVAAATIVGFVNGAFQ